MPYAGNPDGRGLDEPYDPADLPPEGTRSPTPCRFCDAELHVRLYQPARAEPNPDLTRLGWVAEDAQDESSWEVCPEESYFHVPAPPMPDLTNPKEVAAWLTSP